MAKFYGPIGYAVTVETRPGVWEEQITERPYYGDLIRNTRRLQSSETLNDDISVANEISLFDALRWIQGSKVEDFQCRSSVSKVNSDDRGCIQ